MLLKLFKAFEKVLFVLALLFLAGNFTFVVVAFVKTADVSNTIYVWTGIPPVEIGPLVRGVSDACTDISINAAFYLALLMLIFQPPLGVKSLKTFWQTGLPALLLFACASWFWSVVPDETLIGLIFIFKVTVIGIYLSQRYSVEENLNLLVTAIALLGLFSVVAVWLVPNVALHLGGEWRGVFLNKNFLGRMMAFGNLILIVYWLKNRILWKQLFALVVFSLSVTLLVLSQSATSLLILLTGWFGLVVYGFATRQITRPTIWVSWMLLVGGIIAGFLAFSRVETIIAFIKKTPTLTGRTILWQTLWEWFEKHPLFGFGYKAFWEQFPKGIKPTDSAWVYGAAQHAHNGYFDIALGLGIFGLLLFLFPLVVAWKKALTLLLQTKQVIWLWPVLTLFYLTLANMTYSISFASPTPDFHWTLFVIVSGVVVSNQLQTPVIDNIHDS